MNRKAGGMRAILNRSIIGAFLGLSLWCAAAPQPARLPVEVPFNRSAGSGDPLFFMVQLTDGSPLTFLLDTGASVTTLDSSLEKKLGDCLGRQTVEYSTGGKNAIRIYKNPGLYVGGVELKLGKRVWVDDVTHRFNYIPPLLGVLGMDCLQRYCVQLDFVRRKMLFADPEHLSRSMPGKPFRLTVTQGQAYVDENLLGLRGARTIIDSSYGNDGGLSGRLFEQEVQNGKQMWSRGLTVRESCFRSGAFGGETYTNLLLWDHSRTRDPAMNAVGLRFLARHLVTFNFPKRTMYLKQTSVGPLVDKDAEQAAKFLKNLKQAGELPGWSRDDHGENVQGRYVAGFYADTYPISLLIDIQKQGDQAVYHYAVEQLSHESPWRIRKAYQTDQSGRMVEEYPVR